jgi:hypothetical protein
VGLVFSRVLSVFFILFILFYFVPFRFRGFAFGFFPPFLFYLLASQPFAGFVSPIGVCFFYFLGSFVRRFRGFGFFVPCLFPFIFSLVVVSGGFFFPPPGCPSPLAGSAAL